MIRAVNSRWHREREGAYTLRSGAVAQTWRKHEVVRDIRHDVGAYIHRVPLAYHLFGLLARFFNYVEFLRCTSDRLVGPAIYDVTGGQKPRDVVISADDW